MRSLMIIRKQRKSPSSTTRWKLMLLYVASIFFLFALFLLQAPTSTSSSAGSFAVVINTWKREALLKRAVAHYANCANADEIRLIWSESDPPSDILEAELAKIVSRNRLRFEVYKIDDLNNRFRPIRDIKNEVVFSVDDDVIVPCPVLNHALLVWRTAPDTMVGFVPRVHWLIQKDGGAWYRYGGWWSVWWTGTYSMVLTKAAFFHRKYLDMYTEEMPRVIRDYVTTHRNCEDIAMSLLVANATGSPPIWVRGKIHEIGSYGISSLKWHKERREKCLNEFISVYGKVPLVATNMKIVDARREWLW